MQITTVAEDDGYRFVGIPERVVEDFTCGDCAHLARDLYFAAKGKAEFVTTYFHGQTEDQDDWDWNHAAVRMPNGLILDIEGLTDEDVWLARWVERGSMLDTVEDVWVRTWANPAELYEEMDEKFFDSNTAEWAHRLLDIAATVA